MIPPLPIDPSVTTYLTSDHARLDAALAEANAEVAAGRLVAAARTVRRFAAGLRRRIRLEDQVVFPAFEHATGMVPGTTTVLRREHRELERKLDAVVVAITAADPAGFQTAAAALTDALAVHDITEDEVVFPLTDAELPDDERRRLVATLRAFR